MKPFVLITGASGGLGRTFALEYAKKGENLFLTDLENSNLPELVAFLKANFKVEIRSFRTDLSVPENCERLYLYAQENGISVKYLINNAGVLSKGLFEELPLHFIQKQIDVNVKSPTLLCRLFLDDLKKNSPSGILNVSSLASYFSVPMKQVYGATKAYIRSFSSSLAQELKPYDISVTSISPGGLNTTSRLCYQNWKLPWFSRQSILSPEAAVKAAIEGVHNKKQCVIPGFINRFLLFLNWLLPEFIKQKLMGSVARDITKKPQGAFQ